MLRRVEQAAPTDVPVLLQGESGVGKEVVARWLHSSSARSAGPFVAVNAAAVPEALMESELFGHVRGAFTGAAREHAGLFAAADGGTLLIDEIGDLPLPLQAKLLRVLQDGEVRAVGTDLARRIDVRIVCATHRHLPTLVARERFRADLWYRIAVFVVEIPPLRERPEDITALAAALAHRHAGRPVELSRAARRRLLSHSWPGNVRELENAMRHALVLRGDDGPIEASHLPLQPSPEALPVAGGSRLPPDARTAERERVLAALDAAEGNRTRAAALLGISRQALHARLRRHGIGPAAGRVRHRRANGEAGA